MGTFLPVCLWLLVKCAFWQQAVWWQQAIVDCTRRRTEMREKWHCPLSLLRLHSLRKKRHNLSTCLKALLKGRIRRQTRRVAGGSKMLSTLGLGQSPAANAADDESVLSAEEWEHKMRGFFETAKHFQSWCRGRDHLIELHIQSLESLLSHWRCSWYCQWTVGHYLLYLKVLLWTSLMYFKIISFHCLCKDLQGSTYFIHIHLPSSSLNIRERAPGLCGVSILPTDQKKMQKHGMIAQRRAD